jgi:hypothetical protein
MKSLIPILLVLSSVFLVHSCAEEPAPAPCVSGLEFTLTVGTYSETMNLDSVVTRELGQGYRIADWCDVISYCLSHSSTAFASATGMTSGENFIVTNAGAHYWDNSRHYFMTRHDHVVPGHYLEHASIDDHFYSLGSWYDLDLPILCLKR